MNDPRIKTATGPTILLASGNYFDLLDPANSRFTVADIAGGLGKTCRFAGQCARFYSVAEHTWHASFLVPGNLQFAALMHDASEAFLGEVTRPLKSLLPEYKAIEKRVEGVIDERFALGGLCEHPLIKQADLQMLAAEQAAMMPRHDDSWPILDGVEPPSIPFAYWDAAEATRQWLKRAGYLLGMSAIDDVESADDVAAVQAELARRAS